MLPTCNFTIENAHAVEGDVILKLPPTDALDAVLSTTKWMLRKAKEESDMLSRNGQSSNIELAGPRPDVVESSQDSPKAKGAKAACGEASLEW